MIEPIDLEMWQWVAGMAVLCAVGNRLRGMVGVLVFLLGAVFLAAAWNAGLPAWQAAIVAGLFIAGESWGWTKWINCIPWKISQTQYNKHWAYPKEVDAPNYEALMQVLEGGWDKRNYKSYVLLGMVLRGLLWWLPMAAVFAYFTDEWLYSMVLAAGLSALFPVVYRIGHDLTIGGFRYLQKAETIYGAVYGAAWGYLLWMLANGG